MSSNKQTAVEALAKFKKKLDSKLKEYLDSKFEEIKKISPEAATLVSEIKRVVELGGKRFRPAFMYYGYKAAGGQDKGAIIYTCQAIELFHTFALIHDDIIDNADFRRGQPTVHKHFENWHQQQNLQGDPKHFGLSAALLAGDYAFSFTQQIFSESPFPDHLIRQARKYFDLLCTEIVAGEHLDTLSGFKPQISWREQDKIIEYKSGKYTIERPLHLGASLADAPIEIFEAFSNYGIPLGKAFQIQDDILGMFGNGEKIGKPVDSDIKEGKKTFLILKAYERATLKQKRILDKTLGNPNANPNEIEDVCQIVKETKAYDSTVNLAHNLILEAKKAVKDFELEKESKDYLLGIADYMLERDY